MGMVIECMLHGKEGGCISGCIHACTGVGGGEKVSCKANNSAIFRGKRNGKQWNPNQQFDIRMLWGNMKTIDPISLGKTNQLIMRHKVSIAGSSSKPTILLCWGPAHELPDDLSRNRILGLIAFFGLTQQDLLILITSRGNSKNDGFTQCLER